MISSAPAPRSTPRVLYGSVIAICYGLIGAASAMLLVITLAGFTDIWPVFLIVAIMGTGRAFYQPAANSFVPNLVPPEIFPNAVAWHTSTNKIAQTVGPALGGVVYDLFGPAVVYGSGVHHGPVTNAIDLPDVLDHLRSVLGDAAFDEHVARGAAMDYGEAFRYAREQIKLARRH